MSSIEARSRLVRSLCFLRPGIRFGIQKPVLNPFLLHQGRLVLHIEGFGGMVLQMSTESAPLSFEDLTMAYVENNVRRLDDLLDEDIAAWQGVLQTPNACRDNIMGEVRRLEGMKITVRDILGIYRVTEPIDLTFVQQVGEYLDSADQFDAPVDPEYEYANIQEIIGGLVIRNSADEAQAA